MVIINYKVIQSGHVIEIYKVEKGYNLIKNKTGNYKIEQRALFIDYLSYFDGSIVEEEVPEEIIEEKDILIIKENRKKNQLKSKNYFRRLVNCNFNNINTKFITLTFRDTDRFDIRSIEDTSKEMDKFLKRLKRYLKKTGYQENLKFVYVIEFQDKYKRGAVHYHMLANLPYIENNVLAEIWGNGFIGINKIDNVDNIGAYLSKYMVKDINDIRLAGKKAFRTSLNLDKPEVFYLNKEEFKQLFNVLLKDKKIVYSNQYYGEYTGTVEYSEYNLIR